MDVFVGHILKWNSRSDEWSDDNNYKRKGNRCWDVIWLYMALRDSQLWVFCGSVCLLVYSMQCIIILMYNLWWNVSKVLNGKMSSSRYSMQVLVSFFSPLNPQYNIHTLIFNHIILVSLPLSSLKKILKKITRLIPQKPRYSI